MVQLNSSQNSQKHVPGTLNDSNIISARYSRFSGGFIGGSVSRKQWSSGSVLNDLNLSRDMEYFHIKTIPQVLEHNLLHKFLVQIPIFYDTVSQGPLFFGINFCFIDFFNNSSSNIYLTVYSKFSGYGYVSDFYSFFLTWKVT